MARLNDLWHEVEVRYAQKLEGREPWADWLYPNHVVVVTNNARKIAEREGADAELSQVAALLHDVADYKMYRMAPGHEEESLQIAREVMRKFGYNQQQIDMVVDDAIRYHGCHGSERPQCKEGLVLATADALAHFQTDYYVYTTWIFGKMQKPLDDVKNWSLQKIERDLHNKIAFAASREEAMPDYQLIKNLYSRNRAILK